MHWLLQELLDPAQTTELLPEATQLAYWAESYPLLRSKASMSKYWQGVSCVRLKVTLRTPCSRYSPGVLSSISCRLKLWLVLRVMLLLMLTSMSGLSLEAPAETRITASRRRSMGDCALDIIQLVMNSKYNQAEMVRLKEILYPAKRKPLQLDDLDETNESKLPESNKENFGGGGNGRSNGSTPTLKAEMSRLKGEVEEMLRSDEQLDSVLNSTTRFYLQRIRQMSAELPEEIACLEEASNGLISSIPPSRSVLKPSISEHIQAKVFTRQTDQLLAKIRRRLLGDAFEAIACKQREPAHSIKVQEVHKLLLLSHGFRKWRLNIVEEQLEQKHIVNREGIQSLTGLLDNFLNEGKLIVQLTDLVRDQADFAEVLIYEKDTSRLYTYLESYSGVSNNSQVESVSTVERIRTIESEASEIKRYEIEMENSLTRLCLCRKEVLRIDRIELDADYASCDAMINQQIESFRPLSLGAVFMPLLNPFKEVVGMLRLYFLDKLNADIDVRIAEFLGGILEGAKHLSKRLKHINVNRRQDKTQLYCRMLPLLKLVESVQTSAELFQKLFDGLRSIFYLDGVTLMRYENNSLKKVFSTTAGDGKDKKHLLHCLKVMQERNEPLVQVDNMKIVRVGSSIQIQGLLELVQPMTDVPVAALDLLMRYVLRKATELEVRQKQLKERLRVVQLRQMAEKRSENRMITRDFGLQLLNCESFEQLVRKCHQFMSKLRYSIVAAELFLRFHGHYISFDANRSDKVKSRPESNSLCRKLAKNNRVAMREDEEHFEDVASFSWKAELWSGSHIMLVNLSRQLTESTGYLLSVAAPQQCGELDTLSEDLQAFMNCIVGISKQAPSVASKDELVDTAISQYYAVNKREPLDAAEAILKAASGRECRIVQSIYDRCLYRDEPIDVPQEFFQPIFKEGIRQLPKCAGLPLPVEDSELESELQRIELSQLRHCRQQLLAVSRVFGKRIDRLVTASVTFQGRMYVVMLEGPCSHHLLDLYEQIRDTICACVSRRTSFEKQKLELLGRTRTERLYECLHQRYTSQLQAAFNGIHSSQSPKLRVVSLGCLERLCRSRMLESLHRMGLQATSNHAARKQQFSFAALSQLADLVRRHIRHYSASLFANIRQRRAQETKLLRGARILSRIMTATRNRLLAESLQRMSLFSKEYLWPSVFQTLVSNRCMFAFAAIQRANRVTCDNRQSFLSCFVFDPQLKSIPRIFERLAEIEQFKCYLESRTTGARVCWNKQQGIRLVEGAHSEDLEVRFQAKRWSIVWTYPSKELLDLEFKQYLEIVAKATSDSLNNIRKQCSPLVKLMNSHCRTKERSLKLGAMRKWRSELLKESKKLEYSLVEKAYRMNQELSSLTELRQKKRTETRRKQEELQLAKNHIEQTNQLILYEQQEIAKMDKRIGCNDFLYRLREVLGLRLKLRNCWLKWKRESKDPADLPGGLTQRKQQLRAMTSAGLSILHRLLKRNRRDLQLSMFKLLAINSVNRRQQQQSRDFSPIKRPDYMSLMQECQLVDQSHLLVGQFDGNSKLTTFSKIEPILLPRNTPSPAPSHIPSSHSVPSSHGTISKQLKYISENVPPPRMPCVPEVAAESVTTPARLSTSCMGNVRERMIIHNSQVDSEKKRTPLGYKLSNQTMRFLKKFGRESTPSRANQSDLN